MKHGDSTRTRRFDQRPLPAWGVSVILHAVLVVLLGWWLQRVPKGTGEEPLRTAGIVLRHVADEQEWFEGEEDQPRDGDRASTEAPSDAELLEALPGESPAAAAASALPSLPLPGPGGSESETVGDAGEMVSGGGGGSRGVPGGKAQVRVFGAQGEGSSFLYLFDRSASMEGGPLEAAKNELLQSLGSLDSTHQFHILFFNHEVRAPDLTRGQQRVAFANDRNKSFAERFVRGITANSGTDRFAALLKAIDYQPDVIFFLTDEEEGMSLHEIDRVTSRNRGHTAINCIEFGRGVAHGKHNFLVELARRNGGQYVYVDIRKFGR